MTARARQRMTGISLDQDSFDKLIELAAVDRRPRSAEIGWLIQQEYSRRTQSALPLAASRPGALLHTQADSHAIEQDPLVRAEPSIA